MVVKERDQGREPNLRENTLILWQSLEEVEDLYLKDFPKATPLVFSFGKVKVSINFTCYEDCRDYGIGAMSISTQETDYSEFRKDIVIRKTNTGPVRSTVKEYDLDPAANFLPDDKKYPFIMPYLSQPIDYYEEVLDNAKKPNVQYRRLEHKDIDEALNYLNGISMLLIHIDH